VKNSHIKQDKTRGKSYRDDARVKLFGERVKAIRKDKGITQEDLQHKTGFDLRQIGRIERGEVNTSISHAFKIAECLDIEPHELFIFNHPKSDEKKKKG
jgi:transcriptional regulator with XRE-family HTH domain